MNEFVQKELMPQFQRFAELSVQINKPTGEFVEQLKGVMGKLIQGRELQMQGLQREVDEYEGKLNKLFATFWKNGSTQEIVGAQRPKTVFEKQALLKELYEQGKVQKKKRKGEVYELFRKYNRLAALLGTPEKELVQKGRDVSDEAVRRYQGELAQLQADYQTTVVQMQETCVKIDGLFRFLELKRNLNDPLHSIVFSGYSDESRCKDLVQRKDEINALLGRTRSLKQQRKQMLLDYARDIVCLWDHLGVDQDAQDAFLDQHSGLGEGVVGACIDELRRVLTQRGVQLNGLIAQREGELGKLWKHHKAHKKSDESSFKAAIAEVLASQQPKSILVSSTAIMDP
ncbi:MAG: hypothetical protein Q8P67_19075, partial [archaeon]|nr:hypothetical protein [archaeon]